MAYKFKDMPDISTTQPDRLIKYRVSEDRFSAEVYLPGLAYTDFDQKIGGKLSLWSVSKLFEGSRLLAMKNGYFGYPELFKSQNKTFFIASQTCTMTEKLHDIRYENSYGLKKPLLARIHIAHIGKTSFTHVVELFEHWTLVKLGSYITTTVTVDFGTRRPSPLPEWCSENFDQHAKNIKIQTSEKIEIPSIPSDAFTFVVKALHSDSDMNQHVNQSMYVKWCSDGASAAASQGCLANFKKHIELYPMKSYVVRYIGESLVNDMLTVHVWESDLHSNGLHFAITKNGKIIFVMKMEFYDSERIHLAPHLEAKM